MDERPDYHSYLLRMWRRGNQDGWVFHLVDINDTETYTFTSPDELGTYIRQIIDGTELLVNHKGTSWIRGMKHEKEKNLE